MMTNTNSSYEVFACNPYNDETVLVHTAANEDDAKAWAADQAEMNEGWDGEQFLSVVAAEVHTVDPTQFVLAGNATFTMVSKASGKRFTYKVQRAKGKEEGRPWFVSVMTGSDNESSYTYAGVVFPGSKFIPGKKSNHVSAKAPSSIGFAWLIGQLRGDCAKLDQVEIIHAGRCGRCGRKLTVPESVETGIGPECIKHL